MSNDFGGPAFVAEERRGPDASPGSAFDLVIEVPHGATATADFEAVAGRLRSPLPDGLVDLFHVNTDAGAPELALALAESFLARRPAASVALLIARIPRTFLDFNRVATATPPTAQNMVVRLTELELISRVPGAPRTIEVLVPPEQLPALL